MLQYVFYFVVHVHSLLLGICQKHRRMLSSDSPGMVFVYNVCFSHVWPGVKSSIFKHQCICVKLTVTPTTDYFKENCQISFCPVLEKFVTDLIASMTITALLSGPETLDTCLWNLNLH